MNESLTMLNEANTAMGIINPLILKIVIAVLICFIGFVIGKIVQKLLLKVFEMSEIDKFFKKKTSIKLSLSKLISSIVAYFIYVLAIVMALNRLEIATTIITTLVIILVIILIFFIIFGLNDIFANFSAGIMLKMRSNIHLGDYIRIKDKNIEGYVIGMNNLNMRIETKKDEIVFVPNMVLFRSEIIKPKKIPENKKSA